MSVERSFGERAMRARTFRVAAFFAAIPLVCTAAERPSIVVEEHRQRETEGEQASSAPANYYADFDVAQPDAPLTCPLLETPACSASNHQDFLELWNKKLAHWLDPDLNERLSRLSVGLIKELASLDVAKSHHRGMQMTSVWFSKCIPVYLLAMMITTRASPLQPWVLYELGLNVIWSCQYDDAEFFRLFGVTTAQISYLLGLIGQPYAQTPQLNHLQDTERGDSSNPPSRLREAPLVIDVGMGLGADTRYYLRQGFRVVAVEANPLAVETALSDPGTAPYMQSGQLTVLNAAVAGPNSKDKDVSFWVIPHRPEQSKAVSWVAMDGGEEVTVRTVRCADLLRVYGEVAYMKVDVEFNTVDCLASLRHEADLLREGRGGVPGWTPPRLLSLEVESVHLVEEYYGHLVALGYDAYKACRQFVYSPRVCELGYYSTELLGCGSGPFGESAVDYKAGAQWRDLEEMLNDTGFREEFETGRDWFDVHFRLR